MRPPLSFFSAAWFLFLATWSFAAPPPRSAGPAVPAQAPSWEQTLDRVARSVVALDVRATRDFDTERARSSTGTGFVVDAERGLILTNRHMVHEGPVVAKAVFLNHEEVALRAIYRDPVHDFGLYAFDPTQVRHMPVAALPLAPERARVGLDIRVIGNDSGEKISILDGTLARLDRDAPDYGGNTYNDFDTFYLQAASNTSGGSSGSPVVDRDGYVVALNAGSRTSTASAYYLPLDRVVRALPFVQRGEVPPRGTILANFKYTPFDELRRLGLSEDAERQARQVRPEGVGLLVVERVTPGSPVQGKVEPGDILLSLQGRPIPDFVSLDEVLDAHVGDEVDLRLERGGVVRTARVKVADLHALSPTRFLEVGRAILHDVSYQQARLHNVPVSGVYLAQPGFSFGNADIPERAILVAIQGEPVPDLRAAERVLARVADLERVLVRWRPIDDPRQERESVVILDRRWHSARTCARSPSVGGPTGGAWTCGDLEAPTLVIDEISLEDPVLPRPWAGSRAAKAAADALVHVSFDIPYPTAGVKEMAYEGVGVLVDPQGLILVDRDTVPVRLGEATVTVRGSQRMSARVRYLDPLHNFAVLQVDPAAWAGGAPDLGPFRPALLEPGERVRLVALDEDGRALEHVTWVDRAGPLILGASRTPRFRDVNVEVADLSDVPDNLGGVVLDRRGRALGAWMSFHDPRTQESSFHVLPGLYLQDVLSGLARGETPARRTIGFEAAPTDRLDARDRGWNTSLAEPWSDPDRTTLLEVHRVWGGTSAAEKLQNGDILLEVDGAPLVSISQLEVGAKTSLKLRILRSGQVADVEVTTQPGSGEGVARVAQWAGLVVHEPHREVAAQAGTVRAGVYGAWVWYGTPAHDGGVLPTRRVVEVDGLPITTLDDLLAVRVAAGSAVRVKLEQLDGRTEVKTLEMDPLFWPTLLFEDRGRGWTPVPGVAP